MKTKLAVYLILPLIIFSCNKKNEICAIVNSKAGLIIRSEASVNSSKIDSLPFGTEVIILDMNGPEENLYNIKSKWFKIKFNDTIGWAFGGFLQIYNKNYAVHKVTKIEPEILKLERQKDQNTFKFNHMGRQYTIDPLGKLFCDNNKNIIVSLINKYEFITHVFYENYKNDIIIIYEISDDEGGWSKLTRINPDNMNKKILDVQFGGFNLSTGLVDNNFIYLATVTSISKFNLETGTFEWKDDDIYTKAHVDSYSDIILKDKKLFLIEHDKASYSQNPRRKFEININTGKIEGTSNL